MATNKHRAIYDAIDNGNHRNALKLIGTLLSKKPDDCLGRALKAVVLHRSGQVKQAIQLAAEVGETKPADTDVLEALLVVYGAERMYDEATKLFDNAWQQHPDSEELGTSTFQCLVRDAAAIKQQQVGMRLFKKTAKTKYLRWTIMAIILQATDPSNARSLDLGIMLLSKAQYTDVETVVQGKLPPAAYFERKRNYALLMLHVSILRLKRLFEEAVDIFQKQRHYCMTDSELFTVPIQLFAEAGNFAVAFALAKKYFLSRCDGNSASTLVAMAHCLSAASAALVAKESSAETGAGLLGDESEQANERERSSPLPPSSVTASPARSPPVNAGKGSPGGLNGGAQGTGKHPGGDRRQEEFNVRVRAAIGRQRAQALLEEIFEIESQLAEGGVVGDAAMNAKDVYGGLDKDEKDREGGEGSAEIFGNAEDGPLFEAFWLLELVKTDPQAAASLRAAALGGGGGARLAASGITESVNASATYGRGGASASAAGGVGAPPDAGTDPLPGSNEHRILQRRCALQQLELHRILILASASATLGRPPCSAAAVWQPTSAGDAESYLDRLAAFALNYARDRGCFAELRPHLTILDIPRRQALASRLQQLLASAARDRHRERARGAAAASAGGAGAKEGKPEGDVQGTATGPGGGPSESPPPPARPDLGETILLTKGRADAQTDTCLQTLQVSLLRGSVAGRARAQMIRDVADLCAKQRKNQEAAGLPWNTWGPCEETALLLVDCLIDNFNTSGSAQRRGATGGGDGGKSLAKVGDYADLILALCVLESVTKRFQHFQFEARTVALLAALDAGSLAMEHFRSLGVKNILWECLAHIISPALERSGLEKELTEVSEGVLQLHDSFNKEAVDACCSAYTDESFHKVAEFFDAAETFKASVTAAGAAVSVEVNAFLAVAPALAFDNLRARELEGGGRCGARMEAEAGRSISSYRFPQWEKSERLLPTSFFHCAALPPFSSAVATTVGYGRGKASLLGLARATAAAAGGLPGDSGAPEGEAVEGCLAQAAVEEEKDVIPSLPPCAKMCLKRMNALCEAPESLVHRAKDPRRGAAKSRGAVEGELYEYPRDIGVALAAEGEMDVDGDVRSWASAFEDVPWLSLVGACTRDAAVALHPVHTKLKAGVLAVLAALATFDLQVCQSRMRVLTQLVINEGLIDLQPPESLTKPVHSVRQDENVPSGTEKGNEKSPQDATRQESPFRLEANAAVASSSASGMNVAEGAAGGDGDGQQSPGGGMGEVERRRRERPLQSFAQFVAGRAASQKRRLPASPLARKGWEILLLAFDVAQRALRGIEMGSLQLPSGTSYVPPRYVKRAQREAEESERAVRAQKAREEGQNENKASSAAAGKKEADGGEGAKDKEEEEGEGREGGQSENGHAEDLLRGMEVLQNLCTLAFRSLDLENLVVESVEPSEREREREIEASAAAANDKGQAEGGDLPPGSLPVPPPTSYPEMKILRWTVQRAPDSFWLLGLPSGVLAFLLQWLLCIFPKEKQKKAAAKEKVKAGAAANIREVSRSVATSLSAELMRIAEACFRIRRMLESRPGSVPLEALLPETDRATGGQTGSEGLSPSAPSRAAAAAIAGSRAQVFRAVEKAIPDLPEVGAVVAEKLLRSSFSHIATMQEAISRRVSSLKLANA